LCLVIIAQSRRPNRRLFLKEGGTLIAPDKANTFPRRKCVRVLRTTTKDDEALPHKSEGAERRKAHANQ
jgi:hypothetical protein